MLETGRVTSFRYANGQFGFLESDGTTIFFHYNNGRKVVAEGEEIVWLEDRLPIPQRGDQITFLSEWSPRHSNYRAIAWTYTTSREDLLKQLARKRREKRRYKVVVEYRYNNGERERIVLWEGHDLTDSKIAQAWPPNIPSKQTFRDCQVLRRFEVKEAGQNWEHLPPDCPDPRLITPNFNNWVSERVGDELVYTQLPN